MHKVFDIVADLDTPVSAYLKLAPFRPRFLLESVEHGNRLGRYSFIGFGDGLEFRLKGGSLRLNGTSASVPDDLPGLLDAFREALSRAPHPRPDAPGVPYTGGLVGVAGYDLVRRLERVGVGPLPPVDEPEAAYFAPQSILVFDHRSRRVALLHDGEPGEREALRREVVAALKGALPATPRRASHGPPGPSLSKTDFLSAVASAKDNITDGEVYQLVLSIRFSGETDVDPFLVYRALRLLNPSPYMFFCQFDELSVIGSSPEALVRLDGRKAVLQPIAGTRPRSEDPEQDLALERDLLADAKEGAEHVMLVDLARNDLGRVAIPGSIAVEPSRAVERYSHVMHLVSGVRGVLAPTADAFDLFAAAFPAGTVVGAPKVRAIELIDQLEPVRRGVYAGTVGYFGHGGQMDQAIAIRTIVMRPGEYAFQAGAGIVADSQPEREYQEVLAKSAVLQSALELAREGL